MVSGKAASDASAQAKVTPKAKAPQAAADDKPGRTVTILIPTLNEEGGIGPTLDQVDRKAFAERGWALELLIIDGESKDRTREEAEKRGARVIIEPRRGYGRAYKRGFAEAKGDYIVTGDADGTYPLEQAHLFVERAIADGLDFMTCDRYAKLQPGAMSAKHRFGNLVLSTTARVLFFIRLHDSQSGMWVVRKAALGAMPIEKFSEGMAFSQEIKIDALKRFKRKAVEVPGELRPRIGRPVLQSYRDGIRNLRLLFARRLNGKWRKA
jgi:glycosyltransferase involved in cell wall biosynthesis